jgi:Methyltransferase domain
VLARLKRWLHPLRPVLLPIWRPIRPYVVRSPRLPPRRAVITRRIAAARRRWEARRGRIRPINAAEFSDLAKRYPYYRARWEYTSAAGREAADLIARHDLHRALELGPHIRPLIVGADVMVLSRSEELDAEGRVIVHDARVAPWPIPDGGYDLFVALQVFEHLVDHQQAAFREVCRVARHAIISLPIDWVMDDPGNCHHMISHERALSWFAPQVPTRVVEGNGGPRRRLIYVFEDLAPVR